MHITDCVCGLYKNKRPAGEGHSRECEMLESNRKLAEMNERLSYKLKVAEATLEAINVGPKLGDIAIELLPEPVRITRIDRHTVVEFGGRSTKLRTDMAKHRELVARFNQRSTQRVHMAD